MNTVFSDSGMRSNFENKFQSDGFFSSVGTLRYQDAEHDSSERQRATCIGH